MCPSPPGPFRRRSLNNGYFIKQPYEVGNTEYVQTNYMNALLLLLERLGELPAAPSSPLPVGVSSFLIGHVQTARQNPD